MSFAKIQQYTHGLQISCDALAMADYLNIKDELPVIYFQRGAMMAELLDSAWELSTANPELVEFALDYFRQADALGVPQAHQYIKNVMTRSIEYDLGGETITVQVSTHDDFVQCLVDEPSPFKLGQRLFNPPIDVTTVKTVVGKRRCADFQCCLAKYR